MSACSQAVVWSVWMERASVLFSDIAVVIVYKCYGPLLVVHALTSLQLSSHRHRCRWAILQSLIPSTRNKKQDWASASSDFHCRRFSLCLHTSNRVGKREEYSSSDFCCLSQVEARFFSSHCYLHRSRNKAVDLCILFLNGSTTDRRYHRAAGRSVGWACIH